MKFTPVKLARKRSTVARTLSGAAALMTLTTTESASQLNHVWDLLNMTADDKTKKDLEDESGIENILNFPVGINWLHSYPRLS